MKNFITTLIFVSVVRFQGVNSKCVGAVRTTSYVTVTTSRGDVTGFREDHGDDKRRFYYGQGDVFLGIPFLQPPVGNMRFKKPQRLDAFPSSPHNATYLRPACPQQGHVDISEDCLYLNIYTPKASPSERYPVMLWIHGGSLKTGSAQSYATASVIRNFVSRGVVVVTIQYRLGMLGYFTTFTEDFPPNRGALDQVEAIKFVKDEIRNFGGNPYQITLFGQSAGSASVAAHVFSPLSQNLFQGAIMESGSVLTCFDGALGFQNTSVQWAQQLCNFTSQDWDSYNYTALTTCLSNMPYSQWLPLDDNLLLGWQMVQDNYFLPDVPRNLASKRPKIPVMYGNCRDEWAYFDLSFLRDGLTQLSDYSKNFFELFFETMASYLATRELDVVGMLENVYTPFGTADDDHLAWLKIQNDIFTSTGFTGFITREIDWHLLNGNKQVYAFEVTYESQIGRFYDLPGWTPVYHSCEIPFLWMMPNDWSSAASKGLVTQDDLNMADFFADSFTSFAKYGKPNLDEDFWPAMNYSTHAYLDINKDKIVKENYRQTDSTLWNLALPPIIGNWPPERPDWDNGTIAFKNYVL